MVSHIPGKGEQMVRYYGYYSNKSRGMLKKTVLQEFTVRIKSTLKDNIREIKLFGSKYTGRFLQIYKNSGYNENYSRVSAPPYFSQQS